MATMPGNRQAEEVLNLRGMNMVLPDMILTTDKRNQGKVPLAYNCRLFARNTFGRARSPIESRDGAKFYFAPVGETLDTQQTSTTGATDLAYGFTSWVRQSWQFTAAGALTKMQLRLKKNTSFDVSLLEIWSDDSGSLGDKLAVSGIANQSMADDGSYSYIDFRFPSAPTVATGTTYWLILRTQEPSFATETFYISRTSSGSGLQTGASVYSTSTGEHTVTWTSTTGSINFKSYVSTGGRVKFSYRRADKSGFKESLFVHGTTLYKVNDATKVTTAIKTGLDTNAKYYRAAQVLNNTYIVNGKNNMLKYDGTSVTEITLPFTPTNVIEHKNRLFFTRADDLNRVDFSNLAPDYETVGSTNFFYVPDPQTSDPLKAFGQIQDQLVLFTRDTKYMLAGSDIGSFTLRESTGTKGAMNQEGVVADHNYIYFLSDDKSVYRFNGSTDQYISEPISPELDQMNAPEDAQLIINGTELRVYYKYGGSAVHNRMALFYITYYEWFVDTDTYTCCPVVWDKDSNELVEYSSVVGTGYFAEQEEGNHLGAPIDWKYWTPYYKFDLILSKDRIKKFRPYFESPELQATVRVGKDVDYKNSPKMRDHLVKGDGTRYDNGSLYDSGNVYAVPKLYDRPVPMPGRGKQTQFRFEKYGAFTKTRLFGFGMIRNTGRAR